MRSQADAPGTSLARECAVPEIVAKSTSPDAVWRDHRNQFFLEEAGKTTRVMIGLGCFVQMAVVGVFFHAQYPVWRIGALAGLYVVFAVVHRFMTRAPRRDPQTVEGSFIRMSVFAQIFLV